MHRLILLLALALAPLSAASQDTLTMESIAAAYFNATSYCDSGRRGARIAPGDPFMEERFERCAHRDGRFKYVEMRGQGIHELRWSDAERFYRYLPYYRRYQAFPFGNRYMHFEHYRARDQVFPVFVFGLFASGQGDIADNAERTRYLKSYAINPALSTSLHTVFERSTAFTTGTNVNMVMRTRLWVLNATRAIVKYEQITNEDVMHFVEITSSTFNRVLTDADLRYDAPLLARYSLSNNLPVFIGGLIVAAGLLGALFWGWRFARAAHIEDVLDKRKRLWRWQFIGFGGLAILLAVLAAITAGGSGHPPAIAYVYVLAIWCAVAFSMTACFTLASYPLALMFQVWRKRHRTGVDC